MNFLRNTFLRFFKKTEKIELFDLHEGFSEVQKKEIVNNALTTSAQVLMTAIVLTNSTEFIEGSCIFPDGSKWKIKFSKENENPAK